MQVIASDRSRAGLPSRFDVARALVVGTFFVVGASLLAYMLFGSGVLDRLVPSGRATTSQLLTGGLAWTFALTAPAAFGFLGLIRFGSAFGRLSARRARPSPAVRAARAIADDHAVATRVRLPDGSRIVPELVVGPFGAAVIEELPPAGAIVSRGSRSWEVRLADGRIHLMDHPLIRATRDAERVRVWFAGEDNEHFVKVYAAVVGTDPSVERSPTCAYISPDDVGAWLASLPPQRTFDVDRRERVLREIRQAL
ncbi:MAG: hypothetical protein ABIV26_06695 [Candidatus Limnocylindrales bacterium]